MMVCIVLHNMRIQDRRREEHEDFLVDAHSLLTVNRESMPWTNYLAVTKDLENSVS